MAECKCGIEAELCTYHNAKAKADASPTVEPRKMWGILWAGPSRSEAHWLLAPFSTESNRQLFRTASLEEAEALAGRMHRDHPTCVYKAVPILYTGP